MKNYRSREVSSFLRRPLSTRAATGARTSSLRLLNTPHRCRADPSPATRDYVAQLGYRFQCFLFWLLVIFSNAIIL